MLQNKNPSFQPSLQLFTNLDRSSSSYFLLVFACMSLGCCKTAQPVLRGSASAPADPGVCWRPQLHGNRQGGVTIILCIAAQFTTFLCACVVWTHQRSTWKRGNVLGNVLANRSGGTKVLTDHRLLLDREETRGKVRVWKWAEGPRELLEPPRFLFRSLIHRFIF